MSTLDSKKFEDAARGKIAAVTKLWADDNTFVTWDLYERSVNGVLRFQIARETDETRGSPTDRYGVWAPIELPVEDILNMTDAELLEFIEVEIAIANVKGAS